MLRYVVKKYIFFFCSFSEQIVKIQTLHMRMVDPVKELLPSIVNYEIKSEVDSGVMV